MNQFRAMFEQFDKSVLAEFERIRALRHEPNVKGGSYEKVLADFLHCYWHINPFSKDYLEPTYCLKG